jgi:hypothetical protein|nr:MAG TPA: hypothetical protein [Caudoviricetes sp.]
MAFIRFPLVLKGHIQSSIQWYDPSIKVFFTEFIDPTSNTPMVDMEYDPTQIPEDRVQDILQWVKRKSQEVIRPRTIVFPYLLNEEQLKAVIHVLNALGHHHRIEIDTNTTPFTTQFALF